MGLLPHDQFPARVADSKETDPAESSGSCIPHMGCSERLRGVRSSFFFSSISQKLPVKLQGPPGILWSEPPQCWLAILGEGGASEGGD